jgi:mono/diheme cytochrome c family protein
LALASTAVWACSSSSAPSQTTPEASVADFAIVTASGAPLQANVGDAVSLKVVQQMPDGTTRPLPSGAKVSWTSPVTVTALDPSSSAASPIPESGRQSPNAFFIDNPGRPDRNADLVGVLFVLDAGKAKDGAISVSAKVTGVEKGGAVTASIPVGAPPVGDAIRGALVYGSSGANCARCHGATGHGTDTDPEPQSDSDAAPEYRIAGLLYPFPAPGLNDEPGNDGSDPDWTAALFAMAARADMENGGVTLRLPMPDWLVTPKGDVSPPTTQDLFDAYAFMKTRKH